MVVEEETGYQHFGGVRRTGEDEQNKMPLATADVGDSIRQAWMSDRTFCIS
jgi:hypothetical protein